MQFSSKKSNIQVKIIKQKFLESLHFAIQSVEISVKRGIITVQMVMSSES